MNTGNKITKQELYFVMLIALCIALCVSTVTIAAYKYKNIYKPETVYDGEMLSFNEGWSYSDKEDTQTITLPAQINAGKNETVSISNKLPTSLSGGSHISFRSSYSIVHVYIEDKLIYSNETEAFDMKTSPDSWVFVSMQPEYSSKTITITFQSPYGYYSGLLPEIILGTHSEVVLYSFSQAEFSIYVSICVIALGFLMFLFSFVYAINNPSLHAFIYLGLYFVIVGIITLTLAQIPRTVSYDYYSDFLIFNLTVRTAPAIFSMYMNLRIGDVTKKIYRNLMIVSAANLIVSILFHFAGFLDFIETLPAAIAVFASMLAVSLYFDVFKVKTEDRKYRVLTGAGLIAYIGAILAGVLGPYFPGCTESRYFLALGALIHALCQSIAVIISGYEYAQRQLEVQKELSESKIKLMVSQIHPHFIYNTLNTIRTMIKFEPDKAYQMTYDFAKYLKMNIDVLSDDKCIPFSEELRHTKAYTDIEYERFYNRLTVEYNIEAKDFLVPPLSVQPYVENAIKHGVCKKRRGGTVAIKSFERNNCFIVEIEDDGVGFDVKQLKKNGAGLGIRNTSYRLKQLVGADVEIVSRQGTGSKVTIMIPKK